MQWRLCKALDVPGRGTQLSPFVTPGLDEGTIPRLVGWFLVLVFFWTKVLHLFFLCWKTGSSLSWPNVCRGVKKSWKVPNTHVQTLVKLTGKKKKLRIYSTDLSGCLRSLCPPTVYAHRNQSESLPRYHQSSVQHCVQCCTILGLLPLLPTQIFLATPLSISIWCVCVATDNSLHFIPMTKYLGPSVNWLGSTQGEGLEEFLTLKCCRLSGDATLWHAVACLFTSLSLFPKWDQFPFVKWECWKNLLDSHYSVPGIKSKEHVRRSSCLMRVMQSYFFPCWWW